MSIWQADFYRRPLRDATGKALWELLVCDRKGTFQLSALCPQTEANSTWVTHRLREILQDKPLPEGIQVFRPQSLVLIEPACQTLGIAVEPTRHTPALKQWLVERSHQYPSLEGYTGEPYQPLALDQPPPVPIPDALLGERWRFASLPAADLVDAFQGRMIPFLDMPESLLPVQLGLASTLPIPGVVIDGGKQAMRLARWLQEARPALLTYIPGQPDGLILTAGLIDRWVLATFDDREVAAAGREFEKRKQESRGLHFLLVQPDDSGMTYSGFWLLQ